MGKKVRSARGVVVDFDLMQIKKQIAANTAPLEVKARQDFIENRLKRRIKKAQNEIEDASPELPSPAPTVDESHIEDDNVSEALEAVEVSSMEPVKDDEKAVKKKTTKQVARPKKKKQDIE